MRELSLLGIEGGLGSLDVYKLTSLQNLRSLSLQNCVAEGLHELLAALPALQSLHLLGSVRLFKPAGMCLPDRILRPDGLVSSTLHTLSFQTMNTYLACPPIDLSGLTLMRSIDMQEISSGRTQTLDEINEMLNWLSSLVPFLRLSDAFTVYISDGQRAVGEVRAFLSLAKQALTQSLRGKRVSIVSTGVSLLSFRAEAYDLLSELSTIVGELRVIDNYYVDELWW